MSIQPLPPAWVERIFARFSAAFGANKVGTMWPADQHEEVKALWGEQLGRFSPETIRAALQDTVDSGRSWPPTLPEFVEQCRQSAVGRAQHAPADVPRLTNGGSQRDEKVVAAVQIALGRIADGPADPRFWAKHPKGEQAVKLLVRGCERETSLRPILLSLLDDPSPCRSDEARKELDSVRSHPPHWMRDAA